MRPHAPIVLLVTGLLAFAALGAAQSEPVNPQVKQDEDKIVLQNEHIAVWFHGKKPFLKVFDATTLGDAAADAEADAAADGEANGEANASAAYAFKFHRVVEYRDLNGDDLPEPTEVLGTLNLEKASEWVVDTVEENGTIVLNLTLEAPVRVAGGVLEGQDLAVPDRTARISLVFTISGEALSVEAGDTNLTVPTSAIKYDFIVEKWPALDGADSRLALEALVTGDLEASTLLGVDGATVESNGTALGIVAWTNNAQGVTRAGETVDVDVVTATATAAASAEADANETEGTTTRLVHTFDAPELASLVYDPVIGLANAGTLDPSGAGDDLGETISNVPAPGVALVAAAVAGVALLARRRG